MKNEILLMNCRSGNLKGVRSDLFHGADPNARGGDYNLETPLSIAIDRRNFDLVETLVKSGAKVNSYNIWGETPLHLAVKYGNLDMMILFIEYGAEVDALDRDGKTPLMHAVMKLDREAVALFINQGADTKRCDLSKRSVLQHLPPDSDPLIQQMIETGKPSES